MAIRDLTSITASSESGTGIRVQTGNISNQPERIAVLLDEGYVYKRNRELFGEIISDIEGREYLDWKLSVIETAMRERMEAIERAIFKRIFVKHMTYKQIREAYHEKTLYDKAINKYRKSALLMIEREIKLRIAAGSFEKEMAEKLLLETKEGMGNE